MNVDAPGNFGAPWVCTCELIPCLCDPGGERFFAAGNEPS